MEMLQFILSCVFIGIGIIVCFIGVYGTYKFKFVLNRMHSAALIDTCGLFFIILGCIVSKQFDATSIKLLFVFVFLWLTCPISSHLISKVELETDNQLNDEIEKEVNDIKEVDKDDY